MGYRSNIVHSLRSVHSFYLLSLLVVVGRLSSCLVRRMRLYRFMHSEEILNLGMFYNKIPYGEEITYNPLGSGEPLPKGVYIYIILVLPSLLKRNYYNK